MGDTVYVIWGLSYSTDDDDVVAIFKFESSAENYLKDCYRNELFRAYEIRRWDLDD